MNNPLSPPRMILSTSSLKKQISSNNKQTSVLLVMAMGVFGCLSGSASAATIVAGTKIGIAPDSGTPTNIVGNAWNDFTASNTTDDTIHDLDNTTLTGVSVQFAGGTINTAGEDNWVGLSTNGGSAPAEFVDSVTTDLLYNNFTITITGLDTNFTYNLYSTSHGGGSSWDASEDIHSVTGDVSYGSSQLNRGASRVGAFHTFLGVTPGVDGTIVFATTQASGSNAAFNGLLIVAVPEPSSTALLGLGGLALILRRRR